MDEIVIRDAREEDVYEMALVRQDVWSTTYRGIYSDDVIDNFAYDVVEKSFKDKIDSQGSIFKEAVSNNKIVGYVSFGLSNDNYKDYDYVINYLHILKSHQGKGIGRTFFNIVMDYATKNNIEKFYVSCNKYNYPAHKYYEKMGGIEDYVDGDDGDKSTQHIIYVYKVEGANND